MKLMKDYGAPVAALMIICLVVVSALVVTYQVTAPVIARVNEEAANASRQEVMPDATSFTELTVDKMDGIVDVYGADGGLGYVITSKDKGFGGEIIFMTSMDANGNIINVKLLEHSETPGLGTKITAENHVAQYVGKHDLDGIDSISGATISSLAMERAVQKALDQYDALKGAN